MPMKSKAPKASPTRQLADMSGALERARRSTSERAPSRLPSEPRLRGAFAVLRPWRRPPGVDGGVWHAP
jgi:hypothetical protein